ncbi:unnamed protein product [Microthlaspi erraticum]|uniref:BHLH domain-containing protein n=1 Tax=Microthlaspi erraticum TaxID=1685480 RepID=A0A6D2I674_9BRAS|nr:unnamed protein product [Microthlaspi erraticum]
MEAMGEWSNNLAGMYTYATEEADFMNQLLASYDHPGTGSSSGTAGGDHQAMYWSLGSHQNHLTLMPEASSFCFSQESSSYSAGNSGYYAVAVPPPVEENNNGPIDFGMEDVTINTNSYLVGEETSECDVEKYSSGKTALPLETVVENHDEEESMLQSEISVTTTDHQKSLTGSKKRSRATSAEKRRERINERLRILQNLVPNGTKVDISTMLEEAVHYVKFLQLQIKLLSSDDLWMYAPIAFNGMDIGLNSPR